MTSKADSLLSSPGAVVELMSLDAVQFGQGIFNFTNTLTDTGGNIVYAGDVYSFLPFTSEGWARTTSGAATRPMLSISNVAKSMQLAIQQAGDLVGAKLTRVRILGKYLDAANFVGGNSTADAGQYLSKEVFRVARLVSLTNTKVVFELCLPTDLPTAKLPRRVMLKEDYPGLGMYS